MGVTGQVEGSFRDPAGFVFCRDGVLYRQVNNIYREQYAHLMHSGLYSALQEEGLLIPHEEVGVGEAAASGACQVLRPQRVPFVSYPCEWCFSALRAAALATLAVQRKALSFGMSLKDASAYNVQFLGGKPVLIDTLSFERYREGAPWVAYRQFCQHFLVPLALLCHTDARLGRLLQVYLEGVPLELGSRLLPARTWVSPTLLCHVHLHAAKQGHRRTVGRPAGRMPLPALLGVLDSLESAVREMRWRPPAGGWSAYYEKDACAGEAHQHKREIVSDYLRALRPGLLWDLGANTGPFSRMAAEAGFHVIALDADAVCVERCYQECAAAGQTRVLPLVVDVANPTPAVGWAHRERPSLLERGPADAALALALLHHLAIGSNVPFDFLADFLHRATRDLVIEFVPKSDPQVQEMLQVREDVFPDYHQAGFEAAFCNHFRIERRAQVRGTGRWLYLMRGKEE